MKGYLRRTVKDRNEYYIRVRRLGTQERTRQKKKNLNKISRIRQRGGKDTLQKGLSSPESKGT